MDVLVVGGGMAGLLCARLLTDAGADCLLLEARELCGGVTANTTAKITALHGTACHRLLRRFGAEKTRIYYEANAMAIEQYARMCAGIQCGFSYQDACVYSLNDRRAIEEETMALRRIGMNAELTDRIALPMPVAAAVRLGGQAQFDPLRFASAISRGLEIRTHTRVHGIRNGTAVTPQGSVRAKAIIIATHFPFPDRLGGFFLKLYQSRSYVIALKNAPRIEGMYLDASSSGFSFRRHGEYLLMGDGGHRTGDPDGGWEHLEQTAQRLFPGAKTAARWAAQDCMTLDELPYVGRYSGLTPELYVATGFNKWGMTNSMVAAHLLTDMITGRRNRCEEVLAPSRSMLHRQLLSNIRHSASNLLRLSAPRCPHMGCALKWNPHEHTWDCPCHGSRFESDGSLINTPAQRDAATPDTEE